MLGDTANPPPVPQESLAQFPRVPWQHAASCSERRGISRLPDGASTVHPPAWPEHRFPSPPPPSAPARRPSFEPSPLAPPPAAGGHTSRNSYESDSTGGGDRPTPMRATTCSRVQPIP